MNLKEQLKNFSFLRVFITIFLWIHFLLAVFVLYDYKTQTNAWSKDWLCKIINNNVRVALWQEDNWWAFTIYKKSETTKHYVSLDNSWNILDYSYGINWKITDTNFKLVESDDVEIEMNYYCLNYSCKFGKQDNKIAGVFAMYSFSLYSELWNVYSKFDDVIKPSEKEYGLFILSDKYKQFVWLK